MSAERAFGLDYATWKILGLAAFFAAFAALVIWLVLARRSRFDRVARLALEDDDPPRAGAPPERRP